MDKDIEALIEAIKIDINSEMTRWKEIQSSTKSEMYLFHSKEALIDDYGVDYFKCMVNKFETARNRLKNFGKPKDQYDILEIWFLKFDVAWSTRFAMAKNYI